MTKRQTEILDHLKAGAILTCRYGTYRLWNGDEQLQYRFLRSHFALFEKVLVKIGFDGDEEYPDKTYYAHKDCAAKIKADRAAAAAKAEGERKAKRIEFRFRIMECRTDLMKSDQIISDIIAANNAGDI